MGRRAKHKSKPAVKVLGRFRGCFFCENFWWMPIRMGKFYVEFCFRSPRMQPWPLPPPCSALRPRSFDGASVTPAGRRDGPPT